MDNSNDDYTLDVLKNYNKKGYYPKYVPEFRSGQGSNKLMSYGAKESGVLSREKLVNKGIRAGERQNAWDRQVAGCKSINKFMTIEEIEKSFIGMRTHLRHNKLNDFDKHKYDDSFVIQEKLSKQEQIDIINSIFDEAQDRFGTTLSSQ